MMIVTPTRPHRRHSAETTKCYIHSHAPSKIPAVKTLALTGKQGTDLGQCRHSHRPWPRDTLLEGGTEALLLYLEIALSDSRVCVESEGITEGNLDTSLMPALS